MFFIKYLVFFNPGHIFNMCVCSVTFDFLQPRWLWSAKLLCPSSSILEWVAISSSRGTSWPRDRTHISCVSCIGKRILYLLSNWGHTYYMLGFPHSLAGKESTCNVGDLGPIPGLQRSPEEGNRYPLQYPGLVNFMDCIVHGVAKSQTRLSDFHFHYSTLLNSYWNLETTFTQYLFLAIILLQSDRNL